MAQRTVRDLRCPACARVFENELVRHDESGEPPSVYPCPKCKKPARVLAVLKLNPGGTLWSQEEARSRQVFGEDGMREGKRITGGRDYERALEDRQLAPASAAQTRAAMEKAGDMGSTFARLRAEGDTQGIRRTHVDEIAARNGVHDDIRKGAQIADQIQRGQVAPAIPPHVAQQIRQQQQEVSDPRWNADTANQRWDGVFVPDRHENKGPR